MTQRRRLQKTRAIIGRSLVAFFTTVGAASSIAQFFPRLQNWASVVMATGAVASLAYAWVSAHKSALPVDELLPLTGTLARLPELSLEMVAGDGAPLHQVHELAKDVYPGVDPIPIDRYQAFLKRNSSIFVCLLDANRHVQGYFDVLPLDPKFLRRFCDGAVGESDIRPEHILTREQAAVGGDLYLAGISVREHHSIAGKTLASVLVWGLATFLSDVYSPRIPRRLYAEAASKEGETLLLKFNFKLVAERRGRRDPFRVYALDLNKATIEKIESSGPDWSRVVKVHWPRDAARNGRYRPRVIRDRLAAS